MSGGNLEIMTILGYAGFVVVPAMAVALVVGICVWSKKQSEKKKSRQKEADPNANLTKMGMHSTYSSMNNHNLGRFN